MSLINMEASYNFYNVFDLRNRIILGEIISSLVSVNSLLSLSSIKEPFFLRYLSLLESEAAAQLSTPAFRGSCPALQPRSAEQPPCSPDPESGAAQFSRPGIRSSRLALQPRIPGQLPSPLTLDSGAVAQLSSSGVRSSRLALQPRILGQLLSSLALDSGAAAQIFSPKI